MKNIRLDINGDIIDQIFSIQSESKSRIEDILENIVGDGQKKTKKKSNVVDLETTKKTKSKKKKKSDKKVLHIKRKK